MNGRKKLKGMMTKYFCPDCQTNLCIVPCFQAYHKDLEDAKLKGANPNPSNDNRNFENFRSDGSNLEQKDSSSDICDDNLSRNIENCVVPYCENQGFKGFSKFPTNTAEQVSWMKSCRLSFLKSSFFICHKHFKDSCFVNTDYSYKNIQLGLKKGSKPELLLPQVSLQPCFQAKYLEDVKLENFRSDGSNDPLNICDDKLESVHEKENCAEKYEIFENLKLLTDTESNQDSLNEDKCITVKPQNNSKTFGNNFRNDGSNFGENDPLGICDDNIELAHEEKKSNTIINSEEKWKLLQCQFCDKKHFGKSELCLNNPSKHAEQKVVKLRLPFDKLRNDGLKLGEDVSNLEPVHEEKKSSTANFKCDLEETDPLDICDNYLESVHEEKKSDTLISCKEKYKVFETQKLLNDNNVAVRFVSVNDGRKISDFQILGYYSKVKLDST